MLLVRLQGRDLVLDNLSPIIRSWNETGYSWRIMQSEADPKQWVEVNSMLVPSEGALAKSNWIDQPSVPGLRGVL